ncbi:MAG TPA: hypothetical protein PKH39_19870 [Woeseiaceae bacterium]|nr:hypothetical protein [Woeseiaceae bacterium]
MNPYEPPKSELKQLKRALWPKQVGGILVGLFIAANLSNIFGMIKIMEFMDYGWSSKFGVTAATAIATHSIRIGIALLYFVKFRWFFWVLVASILIVYGFPDALPSRVVNLWFPLLLVSLMSLHFGVVDRRYILPWTPNNETGN